MRRLSSALLLAAVPAIVLAETGPADFARAATIRTGPDAQIFKVRLPDDVYLTVTRPDLGDLRVFNAAGEALPHTLRTVPPTQKDAEWRKVPVFAMSERQAGPVARTHVRVGSDGTVLEVTGDTSARRAITAWLVDATSVDRSPARMILTWEAGNHAPFLARVSVLGSNDLTRWDTLVPSAAIAQLKHESATLARNEIELPASNARTRYLQITWPGELAGVTLTGVQLQPPPTVTDVEVRWRTLTAAGSRANGQVQYDTGGVFPVEYVQVEFSDAADVAHLDVRSRALSSRDWVLRHAGFFYALADPSGTVRNSPARIARTTDRYWSLERANARSRQPGREPRIQIGWYPHELVFVRQGSPPYTLAYGNARAVAADAPVDTLLATLSSDERDGQVMTATLEEPRTVAGGSALKPAPRRIVLWVILLTVVAVLAVLAMRIFRESESRSG